MSPPHDFDFIDLHQNGGSGRTMGTITTGPKTDRIAPSIPVRQPDSPKRRSGEVGRTQAIRSRWDQRYSLIWPSAARAD